MTLVQKIHFLFIYHNRLLRTFLLTHAAANTLLMIDHCMEIFHLHSLFRTVSDAESAADAADLTGLHGNRALICGAACHYLLCRIGNQGNQMFGADSDTFTAGLTFFLIHHSYTIHYMDSIKGTDLRTGAVS